MSSGPNIKAIRNLAKAVDTPVIASGGISGLDDVAKLLPLSKHGVTGMITGRAIYNGSLSLRDAIKLARDT
jgi:phosphoribosylformimino-5-aminoimidazole carboxamide ribotide isomerase